MNKEELINKFFKHKTSFFGHRYCIYTKSWRINKNGKLETIDSCMSGQWWEESTWRDFHDYLKYRKKEELELKSDNNINKFEDWNKL